MPKAPATYQRIPRAEQESRWASRQAARRGAYQTPGWKWRRKQVLQRDRWRCRICGRPVDKYAQVDHVVPAIEPDDVNCDTDKLQTLCLECHSRKTRLEMNGQQSLKRFVITGPAGSGKSTWVREHAAPGDFVWDADEIGRTMFNMPAYPRPAIVAQAMAVMRNAMLRFAGAFTGGVYVIETDQAQARRLADQLGAELIELNCPEQERKKRLDSRKARTNAR
jgi:hypothetical protein